ncbi:hypothetical protein OAN307_c47090 [Octadecabacter antarcticus 307]|uniref:Uncharacterized protein n=1 Tax=Octadecabacter antarcticus 307 TaxID=391626 RepID=M9RJP7_9RHOB|nr:hypothetical protein [Octadecabacter antarcticus]AGI70055.1 hypothetical protein OAN307_c47090 [Octadecabacter antarcticus 307]
MFAHSISKTLSAGVLSIVLALTAITPTTASAQISDEDAIAGILALLFISAVVHHSRNRNDRSAHVPEPVPQPRNWQVLPADCLRSIDTRRGNTVRMFTQRCLTNNYRFTNRLPQACHVRVRTENGQRRQGYRARCMRNAGFRTNRH